jgi:hypothetical protein
MFKKGDYIVCLRLEGTSTKYIRRGWVYRQGENSVTIIVEEDSVGETTSTSITYDSNNWRYATKKEKEIYDSIGPYPLIEDDSVVRLVNKRDTHWNESGRMDKYLGGIAKIKVDSIYESIFAAENAGWMFYHKDILEVINPIQLKDTSEVEVEEGIQEIKVDGYAFRHGDGFTAKIRGREVPGKISLKGSYAPYLCQNEVSGTNDSLESFGYRYDWSVKTGINKNNVSDLFIEDSHLLEVPDIDHEEKYEPMKEGIIFTSIEEENFTKKLPKVTPPSKYKKGAVIRRRVVPNV